MKKLMMAAFLLASTTITFGQTNSGRINRSPAYSGGININPQPQTYPGPPIIQRYIQDNDDNSHILRIFENAQEVKMVNELPNGDKVFIVNGLPESREAQTSPHSTTCYLGFRSNAALLIKSKMFNKWYVAMAPETSEKLPLSFSGKNKDGSEIVLKHGKAELIFP